MIHCSQTCLLCVKYESRMLRLFLKIQINDNENEIVYESINDQQQHVSRTRK